MPEAVSESCQAIEFNEDRLKLTTMSIYAILFLNNDAVSLSKLAKAIGEHEGKAKEALDMLREILLNHSPLELVETPEGFRLRTRPEFVSSINASGIKKKRLSDASLEVLAVIAYKQPVTKAEIDRLRGVDCEKTIATLKEHGLISVIGDLSKPGSPVIYKTTDKFLEAFNIRKLSDMHPLS